MRTGYAALLFCVLGLIGGCKSGAPTTPDGGSTVPCPADIGSTSGSAVTFTSGKSIENKICYQATSNWYVIKVPSGDTLLDIAAGYGSSSDSTVQLDVKVWYLEKDGKTLTQIQELIAPSLSDGGTNAINTTVHAVEPGSYYLQVADAHNVNFDATNAYTLSVDYAVDPDSHEPNDTTALATASDSKPGWLAYLNDRDVFKASVAKAGDLLSISLDYPATASAPISYEITASDGTVVFQDQADPQAKPFNTQVAAGAPGTYYLTLSLPLGATPSHSPTSSYTLSFGSRTNPDTLSNHTIPTAACPGGGTGPCTLGFSGSDITLPKQTSYITVPGQHDYYRVDVNSGAAAVLKIGLTSAASTTVKYAVDLLTPDPGSPCVADTDCLAMNQPCDYGLNDAGASVTSECELSHACLPPGPYKFCKSKMCSLCQGAGVCIPPSSGSGTGVCAVPQYLSAFSPMGTKVGGPTVSTAQPLFTNTTYYVNVHDASYTNSDLTHPYSLTLEIAPEPDTHDQSTVASGRNNFYDPYPSSMSDPSPNKSRAIDITAQLTAGTPVTGYISYETDNDWYSFQHPCPGKDCALDFTWTQPGPSPVQVAFYMLDEDLSFHQSFAYTGGSTTKLTMPVVSSFDNQSCKQCSIAGAKTGPGGPSTATPEGGPIYTYYLRVADVSQTNWDFSGKGQYSFTVKAGAVGCPAACDEPKGKLPKGCYCYCAASGSCPSPGF